MLKTIGYAYSEHKDHYHITPLLFYNEPGLEHLEWITTLFPKDDIPDNTQFLNQQIDNFIQYYQKEPLLIIGGDSSCLIGICQNYPKKANLIAPHLKTLTLPPQVILNGTDNPDTIFCIDAKHPLPKKIPTANIIVIIDYDYTKDKNQAILAQLKQLIKIELPI